MTPRHLAWRRTFNTQNILQVRSAAAFPPTLLNMCNQPAADYRLGSSLTPCAAFALVAGILALPQILVHVAAGSARNHRVGLVLLHLRLREKFECDPHDDREHRGCDEG